MGPDNGFGSQGAFHRTRNLIKNPRQAVGGMTGTDMMMKWLVVLFHGFGVIWRELLLFVADDSTPRIRMETRKLL